MQVLLVMMMVGLRRKHLLSKNILANVNMTWRVLQLVREFSITRYIIYIVKQV